MLHDPVVRMMMRADGLDPATVRRILSFSDGRGQLLAAERPICHEKYSVGHDALP